MKTKRPPYASYVADQRDIRVFCGSGKAWERASRYADDPSDTVAAVVCPDDPARYRWDWVRRREVTVYQADPSYPLSAMQRLGELLLQAGAEKIMMLYHTDEGMRATSFTSDVDFLCVEGGGA